MDLINQFKIIKKMYLSRFYNYPYKINFAITSQCNSKCKTCNTWKIKKDIVKELSFDEIEKIFQNLPKTVCWMSFTGGEPFLRKDFEDILKLAIKQLHFLTISSNGLLTNKILNILDQLPDFPIMINFSIDGPKEIHDSIRGVRGAFDRTWQTYSKALELQKERKNLQIGFETTVSVLNISHLKEFLAEKLGAGHKPTLTFAQEGNLYTNFGMGGLLSLNNELIKVNELIKLMIKKLRILSSTDYIERKFLKNAIPFLQNKIKPPYTCVAGKSSLSINPFGEVFPCLIWDKSLENLRKNGYDLKKILKQPQIEEVKNLIKTGQCPSCWTPCEAYQSILANILKINF